jgi:hypothetical protein
MNAKKCRGDETKLKAFAVSWGDPDDHGCVLCYATGRNQARAYSLRYGPWYGAEYIEMTARRAPDFDQYSEGEPAYIIETNDELPEGAPPFFREGEV